jgi:hypothetical protein
VCFPSKAVAEQRDGRQCKIWRQMRFYLLEKAGRIRNMAKEGVPKNGFQRYCKNQFLIETKRGPGVRFFLGISIAHDLPISSQPRPFINKGQRKSFGNRRPALAAL